MIATETSEAARFRPGWRARLGIIQPAPGLMLEDEWSRVLPAGVVAPVTRLRLAGGRPDDYEALARDAPGAAALLADAGSDVIAYACGVGSLHRGPDAEAELVGRLSVAAGGIPVIGMAAASVEGIRSLGARRVCVLTPYPEEVNRLVADYLAACGLAVCGVARLPTASAVTAADLAPVDIFRAATQAMEATPDADLLWIGCSNVRSLELLHGIEAATGRPALSSNAALLWRMLRAVGFETGLPGLGGLLARGLGPALTTL